MLKIPKKYKDTNFLQLSKNTKNATARLRYLSYHHLQQGKTRQEVSEILCVTTETVSNWVHRLDGGLSQVEDLPRCGPPSYLSPEQEISFKERVLQLQKERKGGSLIAKELQIVLREEYQANYVLNSIYTLLKRLDLVWITSRSQHPEADEKEQEEFKKNFSRIRVSF